MLLIKLNKKEFVPAGFDKLNLLSNKLNEI